MLEGIEAVLFDLDGTLVDSMWMWKSIDREYLARFGIELPEDLQSCIEGMSFTETAYYFKERFKIPDDIEKMKADWNAMAYDYYCHRVPLKAGVLEFLKLLKSKDIKMGIATSNSRELADAVIKAQGIDAFISEIHISCEVEHGKPAPDIYLLVADRLGVVPEKCLVFEDILQGIDAGNAAGMRTCAVEDEFSADTLEDKRKRADYCYRGFDELMKELTSKAVTSLTS
ncbi:MAG: HAD family phosphatase [Lachnospiraceae bacterium]|nr:HAD family phosphatase [Lachnospiraceae bacterium]